MLIEVDKYSDEFKSQTYASKVTGTAEYCQGIELSGYSLVVVEGFRKGVVVSDVGRMRNAWRGLGIYCVR